MCATKEKHMYKITSLNPEHIDIEGIQTPKERCSNKFTWEDLFICILAILCTPASLVYVTYRAISTFCAIPDPTNQVDKDRYDTINKNMRYTALFTFAHIALIALAKYFSWGEHGFRKLMWLRIDNPDHPCSPQSPELFIDNTILYLNCLEFMTLLPRSVLEFIFTNYPGNNPFMGVDFEQDFMSCVGPAQANEFNPWISAAISSLCAYIYKHTKALDSPDITLPTQNRRKIRNSCYFHTATAAGLGLGIAFLSPLNIHDRKDNSGQFFVVLMHNTFYIFYLSSTRKTLKTSLTEGRLGSNLCFNQVMTAFLPCGSLKNKVSDTPS